MFSFLRIREARQLERAQFRLASMFDAHLTVSGLVLDLTSPNAREIVSYDIFVSDIGNRKSAMRGELECFAQKARRNDVHTEIEVVTASLGTAWQVSPDFARLFDLTIVEQSNPDGEARSGSRTRSRPVWIGPTDYCSALHLQWAATTQHRARRLGWESCRGSGDRRCNAAARQGATGSNYHGGRQTQ